MLEVLTYVVGLNKELGILYDALEVIAVLQKYVALSSKEIGNSTSYLRYGRTIHPLTGRATKALYVENFFLPLTILEWSRKTGPRSDPRSQTLATEKRILHSSLRSKKDRQRNLVSIPGQY